MTLVKHNPNHWKSFNDMFDTLMTDPFFGGATRPTTERRTVPQVNITEQDDQFLLELAAPGLEKGDFKVSLDKRVLTVSVEKEVETEEKTDKFSRREFNYSKFSRSFKLPLTVKSDGINAEYKNGILNVILPKKEEAKEKPAREIEIK